MNIFIDDSAAAPQVIQYGTFQGNNTTGTQDITGIGYTPGLVLLWGGSATSAAIVNTAPTILFGAAIPGGAQMSTMYACAASTTPSNTCRGLRSDYALMRNNSTFDGQDGVIDVVTGISDGFRVDWSLANSSPTYQYIAFPPALDVHVGTFDIGTSTGTQDITGLGFDPTLVLFFATITNTTEGVATTARFSIGAGVSSTRRFANGVFAGDNTNPPNAKRYLSGSQVVTQINNTTLVCAVDYEGPITDGFRVDVTTAPAASTRIMYVAIGGAGFSADAGTFTTRATDGNQAYTGVGFQPDTMMYTGRVGTALDTLAASIQFAIGAAKSSSNRGFSGIGQNDASSNTRSEWNASQAIGSASGAGTVGNRADLVSFDADGWTMSWTDTSGTNTYLGYIAMRYSP